MTPYPDEVKIIAFRSVRLNLLSVVLSSRFGKLYSARFLECYIFECLPCSECPCPSSHINTTLVVSSDVFKQKRTMDERIRSNIPAYNRHPSNGVRAKFMTKNNKYKEDKMNEPK